MPSFAASSFDLSLSKPLSSLPPSINGMSRALFFLGPSSFSGAGGAVGGVVGGVGACGVGSASCVGCGSG